MKPTLILVAALLTAPSALADEERAWSEASWRADLAAEADRARLTHPDASARLHKLEGLQPAHYLKRRRPEPEVARELSRLVAQREVPAPLLAELFLSGLEGYRFSSEDDFDARAKARPAALVELERQQLRDGLLIALAGSGHPVAPYVLREALAPSAPSGQRQVAALGLGQTRSPLALEALAPLVRDEKTELGLQVAALQGIASVRDAAALELLEERARGARQAELQRGVALSLGSFGSSWAHGRAAAGEESDALRRRAALALVELLGRADDPHAARACIDAIGVVAHPAARAPLAAMAADKGGSIVTRERAERASRRLERTLRRAAR